MFDDNDLKRFKKTLADPNEDLDWMYTGPQGDKFSALLARLEAAEDCVKAVMNKACSKGIEAHIDLWLKASGKKGGAE